MDRNNLLLKLAKSINDNEFWPNYITSSKEHCFNVHLGIFIEPYLGAILEGKKTIESRFSINRIVPYESAKDGDILLLKKSGGPICGIALITSTWYYQLDKNNLNEIKDLYKDRLFIKNDEFWESKSEACYASLLQIENAIEVEPLEIIKRDRRGWVILNQNN